MEVRNENYHVLLLDTLTQCDMILIDTISVFLET